MTCWGSLGARVCEELYVAVLEATGVASLLAPYCKVVHC